MAEAIWLAVAISMTFIGGAIAVLIVFLGLTLIKNKWPDVW